ncbi:hypothetical protein KVR01_013103 [Diaporthe batatas]|uniref:uncharacterized protein n=1 Tax=Diaporthe batatas TaxID=748121 RepID=UPI001D056E3B|nr:uncharacterized protein KVR01_013103 [Diaporthe batatas]KAG8157113.1 hypothetical protein KVR01_013103 [Diaporthe batatas]
MAVAGVATTLDCSLASLHTIIPENATLNYVEKLSEGSAFGDENQLPLTGRDLPPGCAVGYSVPSSANSTLRIALLLPTDWNGRFMASGGSGFSGHTSWSDMGFYGHYGFASMSTNQGHTSYGLDADWAMNNPEAIIDWAHRGIHLAAQNSKEIVEQYYGSNIEYSYYTGCSTGGRQGLKLVDLYPEDFDGALIGSPAWSMVRLAGWVTKLGIWNLPADDPSHIPASLLNLVAMEQIKLCDQRDGVADGIVMDPTICRPSLAHLSCKDNQTDNCLTDPQFKTLSRLSSDWTDSNGSLIKPTFDPGAEFTILAGVDSEPIELATSLFTNMVFNDSQWDWRTLDEETIQLADEVNPGQMDVRQRDFSPFKDRGGKLIMYHGWADQAIPAQSSLLFRDRISQTMGSEEVDEFYRLYMMPGVQHCVSSYNDAPWSIGGVGQGDFNSRHEGPGYVDDAEHNALLALMRWVEEGDAPGHIVASKFVNNSVALGVVGQRPLCAYPQKAVYVGGAIDKTEGWKCQS